LPWTASRSLVYHDKILTFDIDPLGCGGSPRTRASKRVSTLKRLYFAVIGLYSVKTVADRYRHAAYHNKHGDRLFRFINFNDLERP